MTTIAAVSYTHLDVYKRQRLYGSIVEAESGKTVFKNSIPTDMSSELAIDDSEAILYVRVRCV